MTVKLTQEQKIRVYEARSLYKVMKQVLMQEQKIDRNREHFWVIGLATDRTILYIELISMGTVKRAPADPMEVFSFAIQKRSVSIMLCHNHPSGDCSPSEADKDATDKLIQTGIIVDIPVQDHLIISEKTFYSFRKEGLMWELEQSKKYVQPYRLVEEGWVKGLKEGEEKGGYNKAIEMAKAMLADKHPIEIIIKYTGLTKAQVEELSRKPTKSK